MKPEEQALQQTDPDRQPTLHMLCGKIAAGKSTLARNLASQPKTALISEDEWLSRLYPGEIKTVGDYARCAARLRDAMGPHVEHLLRAGISVVLDFPANTPDTRSWQRKVFENARVPHSLHYLDVADEECKRRLRQRNEDGTHRYTTSEAEFDAITKYFVAPAKEEGFNIVEE